MRFTSIKEVIERTGANAKAAECLGKSGAFNSLEELVNFLREQEKYEEKLGKY